MSREIKFRAWIPDIERMYQVVTLMTDDCANQNKTVLVWEHPCVKTAQIKNKTGRFRLGDGVEIMQYTGLKDKNGVEIYEGDIVEWRVFNGANIFEIKFLYGGFKATQQNGYIEDLYYFMEAATEGNIINIIGNIYENPKLLEGNKK